MSEPTTNWAAEWDAVLPASRGVSHRSTTSSRRPGKAIEGTVHYEVLSIVRCEACGSIGRVVDCLGRPIEGWP